jgi:hypothetical protein
LRSYIRRKQISIKLIGKLLLGCLGAIIFNFIQIWMLLARQYRNSDAEEFLSRQTMPTRWECKDETVTVGENGRRLEHPGDRTVPLEVF